MSEPLFSVVLPTFNRAASAAAAVRSVLAQTDARWECLVVDDGSTDATKAALAGFADPRLRFFWNEKNRGQHACRNQALRAARGQWIAFLDSDDLFLPRRLEALAAAIASRPGVGFWFTNAYVHRWGRLIGLLFDPAREIPEGKVPGWYAVGDGRLPYVTTMVCVRRAAFDRTGFFREDLRILEDTELYARMLGGGLEVGVLREPLAVRFLHEGQITRDHERDFAESMEALKSSGAPDDVAAALRARVAREVAGYLWRALKPDAARRLLERELGPRARATALWWATFVPPVLLSPARALRAAWLRLRWGVFAPTEYREVRRVVDGLLHGGRLAASDP
ncbi:MAG: glycosyltransferase family 2 protein [Elusimicrobia bacterium]|nr:glycosyltransferase family 2 protein [Elusimicrobiota bacterium]